MSYPKCPECGEAHLIEKVNEIPSRDFRRCDYWLVFFCWHCGSAYAVPRRVNEKESRKTGGAEQDKSASCATPPSKPKAKVSPKKNRRTS
jgi:hypothetical protein